MSGAGMEITARIGGSISDIDQRVWDGLSGVDNPFVSYDFMAALEESGSIGAGTGWQAAPIIANNNAISVGIAPGWIKSHSQGEYVFDHSWAEAWMRAGGRYYPKLVISVPFTPVPGPRLLAKNPVAARGLITAAQAITDQNNLSSAHALFIDDADRALFEGAGWLIRQGLQFHWQNQGYDTFDAFLATLTSRKRKAIRHERASAREGLDFVHLSGDAIQEAHWDAFWAFYQDTGARKWGHPYLTRAFFSSLGRRMGDQVLLILALRDGRPIAGALNLIGADTLYGRYWGAIEHVPFLHFELCYYQAIDIAIARGLARVEAGAQGDHKLARGYMPQPTWSAHYIPDPGFREAIAGFLERESVAMANETAWLEELAPFKKGG